MALKANDMATAEKTLKEWDYTDANDPELYIAYFNFFTLKGMSKDTLIYEDEDIQRALSFISEGTERFPTRFDIWLGKIYMYARLEKYDLLTSEITAFIQYSDKIKNNWKDEDFMLLDNPEEMFYGAIQDFQEILFSKENPKLFKHMNQISIEMLKYYPRHTQSRLNLSTIHIMQKEYEKSLEQLLKAEEHASRDAVILYNIAYVYNIQGDVNNAKTYFEKTIKNCNDQQKELKVLAQKQLEALK